MLYSSFSPFVSVLSDKQSGLQWVVSHLHTIGGSPFKCTWIEANALLSKYNWKEQNLWRLPTLKEWQNLGDDSTHKDILEYSNSHPTEPYWTSDLSVDSVGADYGDILAKCFIPHSKGVLSVPVEDKHLVRMVRNL